MKLILRVVVSLYESENLIELDLDALSYSGIDYWSQEARMAKVKLLLDDELETLLFGEARQVIAGFYAFAAQIYDNEGNLIYTGVLEESSVSVEYVSLEAKLVELEFMDFLGLLLKFGEHKKYRLESRWINPVALIPSIIDAVLWPDYDDWEPDTESYTNNDVTRLMVRVAPVYWDNAADSYDYAKWRPIKLLDHLLLDAKTVQNSGTSEKRLGFRQDSTGVELVYWEYVYQPPGSGHYLQYLLIRTYSVSSNRVLLIYERDYINIVPETQYPHPTPPVLESRIIMGESTYYVDVLQMKAFYTGYSSLTSTEAVPGDYNARDLLRELLRVANAVLAVDNNRFKIINRYDDDLTEVCFNDPTEFNAQQSDGEAPEITAVCIASQEVLDSIQDHYRTILKEFPQEGYLKTHLYADDVRKAGISHPYELIDKVVSFDSYRMRPLEIDYDPVTHEIEISGRVKHVS